ncbi:hypothetical protein FisN_4Hh084 [Fistulifera solaris]|jgi:hypothetical protein|uniref:RING-type E3 ubiquitin transferase n=1 Tax=Fistulifera solaris TaxID=1519565 RepID=A0A1Z5KEL7_FISSO|nr:hypothetical protein FisN_4Hh084 [Fistulifera solaris]|eukprot:GAX24565.1 hypothetical protein FisN_4Hh084 [Fistulifera solaris]
MFNTDYEGKTVCDTSGNPSVRLMKGPLGFSLWTADNENTGAFLSTNDDGNLFFGRKCDCSPIDNMYCPNEAPSCHVSPLLTNSSQFSITCVEEQPSYIKYVFPIMLLMYTGLWAYCFSSLGSRARRAWKPFLVPCDPARIERMTTRELRRRDREDRQRQITSRLDASHHSALKIPVFLKTKKYNHADSITCSICLQDFQQGDRIGDLPCQHPFHVDCLKEWIQLKNHCPLCKVTNLATREQSEDQQADGV